MILSTRFECRITIVSRIRFNLNIQMICHINKWASITESIDNCQHSPLHIHTLRIAYQITRLSDESMIHQEGLERKVKLSHIFVYNALGAFSTKIVQKLTSVHTAQLVDPENIQLLK